MLGALLLAVLGLVAAPSAALAEANPAIAVGEVTIAPADAQATIGDPLTVSGTWDARAADPQGGDTFTIGLPPELAFPQAVPFQLLGGLDDDGNQVVWGNCLTDPAAGVATCTLTDEVTDKPELVQGTWQFTVEAVEATTEDRVQFDLNGEPVMVDLPGTGGIDDGIELPGEVSKSGAMNANNWSMTWTIDIPGANLAANGGDAHIIDDFGANHVLCDPTGFTVQAVRGSTVVDVSDLVATKPAAGADGFDIVLSEPESGWDQNVTYRITYDTCTIGNEIDPAGTEYENSMQIEGWGEAGQGIGTVTNNPWHQSLSKSGSVLGGADRNGKVAWTVTVPGDQLVGKNGFTFSEKLGAGHQLCTDTISGISIVEQYGPSGDQRRNITGLLTADVVNQSAQDFELDYTIDDEFDFKPSDYRYMITYTTCVTEAQLPDGGTAYSNEATVDGEVTTSEATVPGRAEGKSGSINTSAVTIDGIDHLPQTTLNWSATIPGEDIEDIDEELTLTDMFSDTQTICAAGDPSGGLAGRLNLRVEARDQIDGGGLATFDLTAQTTVAEVDGGLVFTIAATDLPIPGEATSDGFSREYQYVISYTTCTTTGGMDAPGTVYDNTLTGEGINFSSTITQNNSGSGTGTGVTRGSIAIDKTLADTAGAELVPDDATFTVHVKEYAPGATAPSIEYDLAVPLNGDAVSGPNSRGTGWTVELSEPTFPTISGVVFGDPVFEASTGVTPSADGTTAVADLVPGANISVTLENEAQLGSLTVEKNLEGAAADLVDENRTYEIIAAIDTSALGTDVPAQPDRTFLLKAGEKTTLSDLPIGATVTFSEMQPTDDDTLTWAAPVISPQSIVVAPETVSAPAQVIVTNSVTRTVGTFSLVKTVTGEQADNPAVPETVTVTATWIGADRASQTKALTVPTDGTVVPFDEHLLIGTEVTLTETPLSDGSSIAWSAPVWSGAGVSVDGSSAVVSITRDAEAQVSLENHAATSVAGIGLLKGVAGDAAGEVAPEAEFPVTATWTDADGEPRSKELTINAVEPTPLDVDLPAGTVVTITEGESPAFDTVIWGSVTIIGDAVTDNGDGSAEIVVSDQQNDSTLVTVVNEATWAPGTFTLSKKLDGILLDNADVPETVTVTASWLDGSEPTSTEVILPTDGTAVPFGQDLPHGTTVTLAETPIADGAAFTWDTPVWGGDDITATDGGTAVLTIGAAKNAEVTVTNSVAAKLGDLVITKSLAGTGANLVDDVAFPVTATWTDLLGESRQVEIEVRAGEPIVIEGLPLGTEVALTESEADVPADVRWHGATWSADDETVSLGEADGAAVTIVMTGDSGTQASIDLDNEFEKLPDLAVTGGPLMSGAVIALAALLIGVGILMLVLRRRRA